MLNALAKLIFGSKNERTLRKIRANVAAINALEPDMQKLADEDFPVKIAEYRQQIADGADLDTLLPPVFAMVREAGVRTLGMRHYDTQLVGGIVLHKGNIAEMRTGEGKTLVATLPVVLNALSGKGVHLVTVNDYLAKRDAEWMGKLYNFLGLSVGVIVHNLSDEERRAAYNADITYGTNNEFGFDYLRDNMKFYKEQLVQRPHNYAIVDEVDSILIDEARTPLIISGPSDESTGMYRKVNTIIPMLTATEHYTVDEKARAATLTDSGVEKCEELLGIDNLYDPQNMAYQHHILQALKAHAVFARDVDYIVQDDQVIIVDEFTGRLMPGRRFSDGLHQALEAKEGVKVEAENQTLASITFQNYFRLYEKLSGMTGTADTEAVEFKQIYDLEVISIPTNKPMIRRDNPDSIYRTRPEKFAAIVKEIQRLHEKGQPVLVGTISIETSEYISEMLKKINVPHTVLNAKQHEKEAEIVAEAGQKGHVTIATNMAGRGTDIVLGEGISELGGLYILGTERHESRRIDNQLRGRSGRQGDPGESRFFLSLEDDLLRLFGSDRIKGLMQKLGMEEGEPIENKMVSRAIENAQKRVESHNFEIRKTLLDYDNVMNQQREVIYSLRRDTMMEQDLEPTMEVFLDDVLEDIFAPVDAARKAKDNEILAGIALRLEQNFNISRALPAFDPVKLAAGEMPDLPTQDEAREIILAQLHELKASAGDIYQDILRYFMLEELDRNWKDHLLNMDHLRDGIGLRGYGQRDPKEEYKREGFTLFQGMLGSMKENIFRALCHVRLRQAEDGELEGELAPQNEEALPAEASENLADATTAAITGEVAIEHETPDMFRHKEQKTNLSYSGDAATPDKADKTVRRAEAKVGRNDLCPCGSGKKYKKCCGAHL